MWPVNWDWAGKLGPGKMTKKKEISKAPETTSKVASRATRRTFIDQNKLGLSWAKLSSS